MAESMWNDKNFVLSAIATDKNVWALMSPALKADKEFVLQIMNELNLGRNRGS